MVSQQLTGTQTTCPPALLCPRLCKLPFGTTLELFVHPHPPLPTSPGRKLSSAKDLTASRFLLLTPFHSFSLHESGQFLLLSTTQNPQMTILLGRRVPTHLQKEIHMCLESKEKASDPSSPRKTGPTDLKLVPDQPQLGAPPNVPIGWNLEL